MWGDDFHKKFQILEKKISFFLFHLIFLCYNCCSINLKKQSEHSGLRPVTSSLVRSVSFWLQSFLKLLAKELMSECVLLATAFNQDLPHCVLELLKLEACRYAIKFGDELTIEECDGLIKHLKVCESPFICAHGRPSIVSLASVQGGKITEKLPVYND